MAILVRERELREEVARLTRENTRLRAAEEQGQNHTELRRQRDALADENTRLRAVLVQARDAMRLLRGDAFAGSRVPVTEDRYPSLKASNAAERAIKEALVPASDKPATPQPAPDVQTALADALRGLLRVVRNPGMGTAAAAKAADAALLLAGRKP